MNKAMYLQCIYEVYFSIRDYIDTHISTCEVQIYENAQYLNVIKELLIIQIECQNELKNERKKALLLVHDALLAMRDSVDCTITQQFLSDNVSFINKALND